MATKKLLAKEPQQVRAPRPKLLASGKAGVGKTWTALDFPGVYYIDCEGGARQEQYQDKLRASGGVYMGPDDGANDFEVVVDQVVALATTDHEHRTLVIDSKTKLYNTQISIDYEEMSKSRDMTKSFGAEKKRAIAYTRRLVRWIDQIDMNVILICHEKAVWANGEQIGVTFDGWEKLDYEIDLVMNIIKTGPARIAKVGKSRIKQFTEGEAIPWTYAEIAKRFGEKVVEGQVSKIQLASPEQVHQISSLVQAVRVDQDTIDKWFEKAGIVSFNQMPAESIQKCIHFLTNKLNPNQEAA